MNYFFLFRLSISISISIYEQWQFNLCEYLRLLCRYDTRDDIYIYTVSYTTICKTKINRMKEKINGLMSLFFIAFDATPAHICPDKNNNNFYDFKITRMEKNEIVCTNLFVFFFSIFSHDGVFFLFFVFW